MGFLTIIDGGIWDLSFLYSTTFWTYFFWFLW